MPREKNHDRTTRTGTWIALGAESSVRLAELSSSQWHFALDLTHHMVAHNSSGGLIATYVKGIARRENCISLFSSCGAPHGACPRISLSDTGDVVFMCWNQLQDHLVVVLNDKTVRFFDYKGEAVSDPIRMESIPQLFASTGIGFAGVTAFTGKTAASLYVVHYSGRDGYTIRTAPLPSPFQKIVPTTSLLAIPTVSGDAGFPDILIPCAVTPLFSGVYRCTFTPQPRVHDLKLSISGGTVQKMSLSPSGQSIALIMEDGSLYFANRRLEEVIKSPEQMHAHTGLAWCGDKCVACQLSQLTSEADTDATTTLAVVNAEDPSLFDYVYDLPHDLVMLPECDGIRLLSSDGFYQMLQVVGVEDRRVFSVGSRAPSAVLLSTFDGFMSGAAAAAVTTIRDMRERPEELTQAINDCVAAAAAEFDYDKQKRLLRIAAFGKSFCPVYDSDYLVDVAQRIRVRNTLASSSMGMSLTHCEMQHLGDERLIRRLIQCNCHQMAHAVSVTLGISPDEAMMDWALSKLAAAMTTRPGQEHEKAVARKIAAKVKHTEPSASFAELAKRANLRGYRAAALVFLESEGSIVRQVPMLLSVGEPEIALKQAVAANNADLIFTVITRLLSTKSSRATATISSYKEAQSLLLQYVSISESHRDIVAGFFNQYPELQVMLNMQGYFEEEKRLRTSLSTPRSLTETNWEMLQECKSAATQACIVSKRRENERSTKGTPSTEAVFSPTSASASLPTMSEKYLKMHMRLIHDQTSLMRELDDPRFLTASIADMVRFALEHGRQSVAAKLKSDYNIPEKTYQWCMLTAYSQTGQWDLIDDLGGITSNVLPVISGEAFATLLLSFGRVQQARQYVSRIGKIETRMEYFVRCGDWFAAAADCRKNGESDLLAQLRDRAKGDLGALQQINEGWGSQPEPTLKFPKLFRS